MKMIDPTISLFVFTINVNHLLKNNNSTNRCAENNWNPQTTFPVIFSIHFKSIENKNSAPFDLLFFQLGSHLSVKSEARNTLIVYRNASALSFKTKDPLLIGNKNMLNYLSRWNVETSFITDAFWNSPLNN